MNIIPQTQRPLSIVTQPLKKVPNELIYNYKNKNIYTMYDLKTQKVVGTMFSKPLELNTSNFYQDTKIPYNSYHICELEIFEKLKGFGKKFINFAKRQSFRENCEGRVTLVAYNENKAPHIFYRKQGFTTNDEKVNSTLDEAIKNYESIKYLNSVEMYLPTNKIKK